MSARRRGEALKSADGHIAATDQQQPVSATDLRRWRLRDDRGRQTWHYLADDEELKKWPITTADKYFVGLEIGLPSLPKAKTPLQAAENGLKFFSNLQLEPGNWACEYGGPMFLLPGVVITTYVTNTPLSQPQKTEIIRYIFNQQNVGAKNGGNGGWGLHIEGNSTVFGTAMNYTTLRLLGVSADHPRLKQARSCLHGLGTALNGPHWAKFWLSVLGVMRWDIVNPVPPELWLLPDWVPISPWRWWIHMRMVFLPMGLIWSKQWSYPKADSDPLVRELRRELFTAPHEEIAWGRYRNAISPIDNYNPKSWILNLVNHFLVVLYIPFLRFAWLVNRAEQWVWNLVQIEDANTDYADLAPVNAPMNMLCCYIQEGPDAYSVKRHRERLEDYLWLSDKGLMCCGTNGVQNWDTSFLIQAVVEAGLGDQPQYHSVLQRALDFLEDQQILDHAKGYEGSPAYCDPPKAVTAPECGYRHVRRGAWGFSTRTQGYTVSDCTAEALKSILLLQNMPNPTDSSKSLFPTLVSEQRLKWAVDILLTMQNTSGACSSYEPMRGSEKLEYLNAAEVFGRIMVEYEYPECTTACVTAFELFRKHYPDYRTKDIRHFTERAVAWIRKDQRPDGSWYGSWAICFTYAGMFALESLATQGETYANSERVRRACKFFLDHQLEDGGWSESYRACETGVWHDHPDGSQVVHTAWVIIALLHAQYPHKEPIERGIKLIMERQQPNGEWLQEAIEGVFNKSCTISYPNYKFIFPIKALGMYSKHFGNSEMNGHA
ncbi:ERG7, lanosterol synthase [Teratosphaeria nubilosa]|uniref:Terpene cyclase/mutase family member n=1 Tax=Teratosphaeria nubilosa TaxID=161662 RepID=A0A6G1LA97_9PEZI|nr:ERG7, lanosterol synthase [Teratosphaeria nubilosa]